MRYFFRRRTPPPDRVLLVESGGRHLAENVLPVLRERFGASTPFDLVTCYAGRPRGFDPEKGNVYRVAEYAGRAGRQRLYRELAARRCTIAVVICSGEPILFKWKWALVARLPVKVLILNENDDFFWCDYGSWRIIRQVVLFRAGLTGAGAVRTLAGVTLFPFTFAYLAGYAAWVHIRRKVHA